MSCVDASKQASKQHLRLDREERNYAKQKRPMKIGQKENMFVLLAGMKEPADQKPPATTDWIHPCCHRNSCSRRGAGKERSGSTKTDIDR